MRAELAESDKTAKAAKRTSLNAGKPTLLAALERVKILDLSNKEAKTIANTIGHHSAKTVANNLTRYEAH